MSSKSESRLRYQHRAFSRHRAIATLMIYVDEDDRT
jgi:hypothetical protein